MIIAWLLGAALSASAHDFYPIRPVQATLRVEPDRIVADIKADSTFWIEEVVGLHPMPARDWPAEALAKAEAYVNAHLLLAADGRKLSGTLVEARYRQLPGEVNEEGTFFLRLEYPPAAAGSTLTCAALFYDEYRKELQSELGGRPLPYAEGYKTEVSVPGRKLITRTLTATDASFNLAVDEARRPAASMALESLRKGAGTVLGTAAGFPVLLAVALCLETDPPLRAALAVMLASIAWGFGWGRFYAAPSWLVWSALLAATAGIGRRRFVVPASVAATAALGAVWRAAASPLLPHSRVAFPFALAGAVAAAAVLLAIARLAVRAEHRRLATVSQSRVAELFARRARLAATVLAMIGAYGFWQSFQR